MLHSFWNPPLLTHAPLQPPSLKDEAGGETPHMSLWICTYRQNTKYPTVLSLWFHPLLPLSLGKLFVFCLFLGNMWSQKAAAQKKMMKKKKTESGKADRLGDSDMMTGEKSKQSQIRLSACTALTYLGLFEAPCFLLITSFLLLPQLFTISLLKVMIQNFQTLFTHSLLFCYHLSIYTALSIFHIFSALQKFTATSPTSEVKWGE